MFKHVLLPVDDVENFELYRDYEDWIKRSLLSLETQIDNGDICSSYCLQGYLSEILLYNGEVKTDWLGILKEFLTDEENSPLAYSATFGKRLYKFNHWVQSPIHAIHTHWYLEKCCSTKQMPEDKYLYLIEQHIQPNGWIYNSSVSYTRVTTRMKSELTLSMLMGIEILEYYGMLGKYKDRFCCTLSSMPITPYIGAEYFRLRALQMLEAEQLFPEGVLTLLDSCFTGLGYCDFSIHSKKDDYMGTKKRVSRDEAVHSPLFSVYADYLTNILGNLEAVSNVKENLANYTQHLKTSPFNIPSFRMRDIEIPFGVNITPLELVSVSYLIYKFSETH